tara:strand:- start:8945 stop:10708 length:1764 start_codon:yes stop_codon:yes gene_type:complete
MRQSEFAGIFSARPQNFAWFLGAGASRNSGLPTATDIIWDLKKRHYCKEENQEIEQQDIQNPAIRERIQQFMDSREFPPLWADNEYTAYFRKIFGDDKERQRKYLKAILSEERVSLSVGNRVLAALMSDQKCRAVFTTNFDTVVENAIAEVSGKSINAYHIEGAHSANVALNNEEFPLYCKIHGDFRYDSIKNLEEDLKQQNEQLSDCFINACSRFGLVVAGYSGRDASVMELFQKALQQQNAFPHGLYWTGIGEGSVHPEVENLIDNARTKGVDAHLVSIDTYDSLMLRLWRNIEGKNAKLDHNVRKSGYASVAIELPKRGKGQPIVRCNALPVISAPQECYAVSVSNELDWDSVKTLQWDVGDALILTKAQSTLCWGDKETITDAFESNFKGIQPYNLPENLGFPDNLNIKRFYEEALCKALVRDKPLLKRFKGATGYLIADAHSEDVGALDPLFSVTGKTSGKIQGLFTEVTDEFPQAEQVCWSEATRVSLEVRNGQIWLLFDPDIWIWPNRARHIAREFLDKRRADRYNKTYNGLLSAWVEIILGTDEKNAQVKVSAFDIDDPTGNPTFTLSSRTAFTRRLAG